MHLSKSFYITLYKKILLHKLIKIINLSRRIRSNVNMAKQSQNQNQNSGRDITLSGGAATTSTTGVSNQPTSDERITLIVDNTR